MAASPARTARRRSGPSALATDRVAAQRRRPPASVCSALPATGPRWSSSTRSTSGMSGEHRAQLARPGRVERRTRRVLPSWRHDRRDGAPSQRARQRGGEHAALVDRDGLEAQALGAQQVEQGRVTGVLDRDAVSGAQLRLQHPLDAVQRAADDADLLAGDPVGPQLGAREVDQRGELGRLARRVASAGRIAPARRRGRGAAPGRGCPTRGRGRPAGTGIGRGTRRDGGPLADAGAAARLGDDHSSPAQLGQARRDGRRAEADLGRQSAAPRAAAARARAAPRRRRPRCSRRAPTRCAR